jgi:hypothetical protein
VRPSVRASASAALNQALLQGKQLLGPERISSAALARPPQVAQALCLGTATEQGASRIALLRSPQQFRSGLIAELTDHQCLATSSGELPGGLSPTVA